MKHLSIRVWQEVACVRCACGISHLVMFDGAPTLTEVIEGDLEWKERVERLNKGQRWRKERTIREKREFLSCLIDSRFTGERRGKRGKARREKQRAGTEGRSFSALGRRRYADGRRKKTGRRQLKTGPLTGLNSTAGDKTEEEAVVILSQFWRVSQKEAQKQMDKKNF